jgi:hypothetical protein
MFSTTDSPTPGMHTYRLPGRRANYILYDGAQNFEVVPRFLDLFTPALHIHNKYILILQQDLIPDRNIPRLSLETVSNHLYSHKTTATFRYFSVTVHLLSSWRSSLDSRHFRRFSQFCEKRLLASSCPSVRLSVRMEQLGYQWTDFDKIWYLGFFRKYVEKIKVSLKSDKNNGYFTPRLFTFMTISSWILLTMRNVLDKSFRGNQNTHFTFKNFFSFIR